MCINFSSLAFGTLIFSIKENSQQDIENIFNFLLENNINTLDTANSYSHDDNFIGANEKLISNYLKHKNFYISTKGGSYRKNGYYLPKNDINFLRKNCENSLNNLKIDSIPIYYLHAFDRVIPIKKISLEMKFLKEEGKILNIGLSNVDIQDILEFEITQKVFSIQNRLNPYFQKDFKTGMLDFCKDNNIKYYAYGVFNNINQNLNDNINLSLKKIANKYNTSPQIISLLWLKSKNVIPIISSTNINNLKQCIESFNNMSLEKNDIYLIDEL